MTLDEARYVIAHREMYTVEWYLYAVQIVENAERQGFA
jgi:hypothetical protein